MVWSRDSFRVHWLVFAAVLLAGIVAQGQSVTVPPPVAAEAASRRVTWNAAWAITEQRPGYGWVSASSHYPVHAAKVESGAYHHHPQITRFNGTFFASWSNHPSGEDGPGQKVVGAWSSDGKSWNSIGDVFAACDRVADSDQHGRYLHASPGLKIGNRLFAVAVINDSVGYGEFSTPRDGIAPSSIRTSKFPKRLRTPQGYLVREVFGTQRMGPAYWIGLQQDQPPMPVSGFERLIPIVDSAIDQPTQQAIRDALNDPVIRSPWGSVKDSREVVANDGHLLCEPTTAEITPGKLVRYWRDLNNSQKLYVQFSLDRGELWTTAVQTTIPDAPSKTQFGRLPDGQFYLIGNHVGPKRGSRRDPLTIGLSTDGTNFHTAYTIRWRSPPMVVPARQVEPDGRGRGFQYPSVTVGPDDLWVIYSVNKEAIEVSRIPLTSLTRSVTGNSE